MEWDPLPETVCRMAGILLLQNLHFHRPWWSEQHPSVHGRIYSVSQATGPIHVSDSNYPCQCLLHQPV